MSLVSQVGWVASAGAVVCAGLAATANPRITIAGLVVSAALFSLFLLRRRLAPTLMSPVNLVVVGMIAVAVFGGAFYSGVQDVPGGGSAVVVLSAQNTQRTFILIMVCAVSILAGAAAFNLFAVELPPVKSNMGLDLSPSRSLALIVLCLVPIVIILWGDGATLLWRRSEYIAVAVKDGGFRGLAGVLSIGAVLALGYLARSVRGGARVLALLGAVTYLVIFFGDGSRRIAMWPILFMLGWYLVNRSRKTLLALVGVAGVSIYLIKLPLYLRGLPSHGIAPYWSYLSGFPDFSAPWASVSRNILISFGIIGDTAYSQDPISASALAASLNPLPGSVVGWYDFAPSLRINEYTPFAGVGELGNQGMYVAILYFLVVGVVLASFDRKVIRLLASGQQVLGLALVGLSGLFLLYSVQYNLRTSTRMLIYATLFNAALGLAQMWWSNDDESSYGVRGRARGGVVSVMDGGR